MCTWYSASDFLTELLSAKRTFSSSNRANEPFTVTVNPNFSFRSCVDKLGTAVGGDAVGDGVGGIVGDGVGDVVGDAVGAAVGDADGDRVGDSVGTATHSVWADNPTVHEVVAQDVHCPLFACWEN